MKILIAGPGCPKCQATEKNVRKVCDELHLEADISHLRDFKKYVQYGIRLTPAVVIDSKVVISGKVPSNDELRSILSEYK